MWVVFCFALLLAVVVLFTLLLIRDGMDRNGWGCGLVGDELYRARCLVQPVCVCLWNNTAVCKEASFGKEKQQRSSFKFVTSPGCHGEGRNYITITRLATAGTTVQMLRTDFHAEQ
jgi:hypothetical protein